MGCQLHTVSALIEALSDETERIPKMSPIRPWLNMFDKLKTRYDLCLCCWHCFSGNKYLQTLLVVGDTFPVYWRCSLNLFSFRRTCVYPKKENVTGGSRLRQKFFCLPGHVPIFDTAPSSRHVPLSGYIKEELLHSFSRCWWEEAYWRWPLRPFRPCWCPWLRRK